MGRGRNAFTLIELLVAVALIGVLVGVLLPTLASARNAAHTVACLSNQRQVGVLFEVYATDFDRLYPYITAFEGVPVEDFWINQFLYRLYVEPTSRSRMAERTRAEPDLPFLDATVFECPGWAGRVSVPDSADRRERTYGMNSHIMMGTPEARAAGEYGELKVYQDPDRPRFPSDAALILDNTRVYATSYAYRRQRDAAAGHDHLANALYYDGSGKTWRYPDLPNGENTSAYSQEHDAFWHGN